MLDQSRACPVCGDHRPAHYCVHESVLFVRCQGCGSIYQALAPDWEKITQIYQDDYHSQRGHDHEAVEDTKRATTQSYLRLLKRLNPPGRRLVEVGCSAGAGLEAAAAAGWEAEGVELSVQSAEIARNRKGVKAVHTGELQDAPFNEGEVDVFVLLDVIEHVDAPLAMLREMLRLLRPGGLLLMVTPDAGSLSARMSRSSWCHLFLEHVVMFSREGMRRALNETGYDLRRIGFAWKRTNLDSMMMHSRLHPHISFGWAMRGIDRVLPGFVKRCMFPFNIGEFYVIASRPD